MKKIFLLLLLTSLTILGQQSDKNWTKVIENENLGKIKTANNIVATIYKQASTKKDEPQFKTGRKRRTKINYSC